MSKRFYFQQYYTSCVFCENSFRLFTQLERTLRFLYISSNIIYLIFLYYYCTTHREDERVVRVRENVRARMCVWCGENNVDAKQFLSLT